LPRYHANLTAGSLKIPESRIVADLLLRDLTADQWQTAVYDDNVLQTRSRKTAGRLVLLLRGRLETMESDLWRLVRDGNLVTVTHACLAAAIKHSALLGDFMDLVLREQYRLLSCKLSPALWRRYIDDCHSRDPELPIWAESTVDRLRSTVFQILAQGGYLDSTRGLNLQAAHIDRDVINYLKSHREAYVLRCIEVRP
jgi:hypothetical protein